VEELCTAGVQTVPLITLEQLHEHRKPDDCWIAINGKVYDVSKWAIRHPGGEHLLHNMAGEDATGVYKAFHTPHGSGFKADKLLKYLPHVADLVTPPPTALQIALNELHDKVDKDGLYNTRPSYYLGLGVWLTFLLTTAVYLTVNAQDLVSTLLSSAVFALFLQQCAFVGHDAAHNGITHDRSTDIMIGMVYTQNPAKPCNPKPSYHTHPYTCPHIYIHTHANPQCPHTLSPTHIHTQCPHTLSPTHIHTQCPHTVSPTHIHTQCPHTISRTQPYTNR
jgi:predicted heme/steroid binding protein